MLGFVISYNGTMSEYVGGFVGLSATNERIGMLRADFSGLKDLEKIIDKVLRRIALQENVQQNVAQVKGGSMTMEQFDGWFAPIVRQELGKTLGIVRNKAMQKVPASAKSVASAILRRQYKDEYKGNINILGNRKRISFQTRTYPEPTGGVKGIRRHRSVSSRTKKLYEYFGPDRAFILRFLESGTDVRTAHSQGPSGRRSQATYGNRGNIGARSFFGQANSDMEAAAKALGTTLVNYVEKWVQKIFDEEKA